VYLDIRLIDGYKKVNLQGHYYGERKEHVKVF